MFKNEVPGGWCELLFRPHVKQSSQKTFLGTDSFHSPGCMMSWPRAEIHRLKRRSSRREDFELARSRFLQELRQVAPGSTLLEDLARIQFAVPTKSQVSSFRLKSVWLVLPYHPLLDKAKVGSEAARVAHSWLEVLAPFIEPFQIRVSWANPRGHMQHALQGISLRNFLYR